MGKKHGHIVSAEKGKICTPKRNLDKLFHCNDSFSMQLRPELKQTQKFVMNTQLYQSIKLMELPIVDLREKIEEELERNPALEVLEDRTVVPLETGEKPGKEVEEYFEASSDSGFISKDGEAASDERQRFIEGVLAHSETLQEHLLWQIQLEPIDKEILRICELLIQNLTDDGFHKVPVDTFLKNEDPQKIARAMKVVQGLDPIGTCTANYLESLRVQIDLLPDAPKGIVEALSHLQLLERGKITEVAKKMDCDEGEVLYIFERLKELSPFPGRSYYSGDTRFVIPDIQVVRREDEFVIILNDEEIPVLGINPFFLKIAGERVSGMYGKTKGNTNSDKPVRDFAKENIKEARWFFNSINQRNHTLLRVSRAILDFQRPFFMNGPKYLAPLTLQDIAQELGIHEATVSRTANGKYMQTEWGVFKIRHFFSNSIKGPGSGGSRFSKVGVKEIIREIIKTESGRLSDKDIVESLAKRGIPLARRTVAKYRNELAIGSSYER